MLDKLKGKTIALIGFGTEGRATFQFLRKHDIKVTAVLDLNENINPEDIKLLEGVEYIGGSAYIDNLSQYDFLFRSPGVPRLHPKLLAFSHQENIYSQTKLFFDLCPCPVIAITGTKGKTTTTSLIYEIIKKSGADVYLGGNIGEPSLSILDSATSDSLAVLELSSFQSQDLHKSPHIGVILNVTEDHLGGTSFRPASHTTHEEYLKAKAQLIANQSSSDYAILHPELNEVFTQSGNGQKIIINKDDARGYKSQLLGEHNLENIAAALAVSKILNVKDDVVRSAIEEFQPVSMRLQTVANKNGITYINDSASTNPDATLAALKAIDKNIVLILGGSDKGIDYSRFTNEIKNIQNLKAVVLVGQLTEMLLGKLNGLSAKILTGAQNMSGILSQANSVAESGDVVLLSPAAASFGMFKSHKDRGDQFNEIVNKL